MDTHDILVRLCALSIGLLFSMVTGQHVFRSCVDTYHNQKTYALSCGDQGQVVNIDYTSGVGSCSDQVCEGQSPWLLINMHDCHWQPWCTVPFPRDWIVKTSPKDVACMGRPVQFLDIKGYTCSNTADEPNLQIFDICEMEDTVVSSSGIIRSHSDYPWNYMHTGVCSMALTTHDNKTLHYTVMTIDVRESDVLSVTGPAREVGSDTVVTMGEAQSDTRVVFNFMVSPMSTFGKGFLICFKFYPTSESVSDVCADITREGHLETTGEASLFDSIFPVIMATPPVTTTTIAPKVAECIKKCEKKWRRLERRCKKGKGRKKDRKGDKCRPKKERKRNRKSRKPRRTISCDDKCANLTKVDCASKCNT